MSDKSILLVEDNPDDEELKTRVGTNVYPSRFRK